MPKISALPSMTAPDTADPAPVVDDSVTITKKLTLGGLRDWLYSLVNIPAGPASPVTRDSEHFFDHVASGLVITGDAYASTRNASMTAGVCYINGRRISLSAVVARTYTASRDTYVDVLDNGDGTGTLVYTEVTNNNASPSLAANSIRIGIVVTGASNIASVASINQGQEGKVLPIASSIPYMTTDSLGNLICSRDPNRKILSYRQLVAGISTGSTTVVAMTGLSCPLKGIPLGRKIKVTLHWGTAYSSGTNRAVSDIWEGTVGSGTLKATAWSPGVNGTFSAGNNHNEAEYTPSSQDITINGGMYTANAGTASFDGSATNPGFLRVELA